MHETRNKRPIRWRGVQCHRRLHQCLSKWQPPGRPTIKISSTSRHYETDRAWICHWDPTKYIPVKLWFKHNGYIVCFERARLMCWGWDQRPPVPDNIFKYIFLYEIALLFKLKLHWYFARNGSVNDMTSLVRTTAWHQSGAKTLRERMLASFTGA